MEERSSFGRGTYDVLRAIGTHFVTLGGNSAGLDGWISTRRRQDTLIEPESEVMPKYVHTMRNKGIILMEYIVLFTTILYSAHRAIQMLHPCSFPVVRVFPPSVWSANR